MESLNKFGLWLSLGGALACGGDSSGKRVDTGLPEATALRDVTSSESQSACENVRSSIQAEFTLEKNTRSACELFGAALTETSEECQVRADTCVDQTESGSNPLFNREQLDFAGGFECDGDTSAFEGCSVTVGEYENCMDAQIERMQALFARYTCAQAASIQTGDAQTFVQELSNPETPAACERLQTECPEAAPFTGEEN
jgi:hypothetical protein